MGRTATSLIVIAFQYGGSFRLYLLEGWDSTHLTFQPATMHVQANHAIKGSGMHGNDIKVLH